MVEHTLDRREPNIPGEDEDYEVPQIRVEPEELYFADAVAESSLAALGLLVLLDGLLVDIEMHVDIGEHHENARELHEILRAHQSPLEPEMLNAVLVAAEQDVDIEGEYSARKLAC